MGLDSIVNVQISAETASVTQAGFGTPLIYASGKTWPERVRTYTSAAAMLEDGFEPSGDAYKAAAAIFAQNPRVQRVKVAMAASDPEIDIPNDLAAISAIDDDWYALVLAVDATDEEILDVAAYVETLRKIFAVTITSEDAKDPSMTDDLASKLAAAGYARTFAFYSDNDFAAAALLGRCLPTDPGSETWAFKTLAGITPSKLTETEKAALRAKKCNFYIEVAGVPITQDGITASGEYIDIVRGVDWLQARMQESIFGALVRAQKVPFTDAGIAVVEAQIRAVLSAAVGVGLLADDPAPTVVVPRARDVPQNDRAQRKLTGIRFSGVLAGAIHSLEIQGTVTV